MIDPIAPPLSPSTAPTTLGAARPPSPASGAEAPTADFAAMLGELASGAATALKTAETTAVAGVRGKASVQQVVEAVMAAEQTLQGAIAIRDKAVAAYLELSRMSI